MSTCNRLDLQTLGSQLIMPKNVPDQCYGESKSTQNLQTIRIPIITLLLWHRLAVASPPVGSMHKHVNICIDSWDRMFENIRQKLFTSEVVRLVIIRKVDVPKANTTIIWTRIFGVCG